jgi:hypothetical protein
MMKDGVCGKVEAEEEVAMCWLWLREDRRMLSLGDAPQLLLHQIFMYLGNKKQNNNDNS